MKRKAEHAYSTDQKSYEADSRVRGQQAVSPSFFSRFFFSDVDVGAPDLRNVFESLLERIFRSFEVGERVH